MTHQQIEAAFSHREKPSIVIEGDSMILDNDDAAWFAGRDWRAITWEDWQMHYAGIFAMTREAFAYYLPSILSLSITRPTEALTSANSLELLLSDLCYSPDGGWNGHALARFESLTDSECQVLADWLKWRVEHQREFDEGSGSRALDTLAKLRQRRAHT